MGRGSFTPSCTSSLARTPLVSSGQVAIQRIGVADGGRAEVKPEEYTTVGKSETHLRLPHPSNPSGRGARSSPAPAGTSCLLRGDRRAGDALLGHESTEMTCGTPTSRRT